MQSFADYALENGITDGMENPAWISHLMDHREYLLRNSAKILIDPNVFEVERTRPIITLKRIGVKKLHIGIIMLINGISLADGFKFDQQEIFIPTDDAIKTIVESFTAASNL